jgi:hypothetical protein
MISIMSLALASRGVYPRGIALPMCGVRFRDSALIERAFRQAVGANFSRRGAYSGSRRDKPGGSLG